MQRHKIFFLSGTVLIACVGCGGGGSSSPAGATTAPAGSSPPPAAPTAPAAPTTPATPPTATQINDTDQAVIYSRGNKTIQDWDYFHPAPEDYQQDEHSSNFVRGGGTISGVGAVINFSGTGITWIGKKGPQYGIASYSVDGGAPQTVDNYSSAAMDQDALVTVSGLSSQSHVLAISVVDQKNAAATGYWQTLDAFNVDGTPLAAAQGTVAGYNSSELQFSGTWSGGLESDGSDLSGGHYWSNQANASVSWTFVGSLIEVFGRPDYEDGYMNVYLDASPNPVASVDGHFGSIDDDSLNSYMLFARKLSPGQHTIKLVVAGKHDSGARDNYVQIDELVAFQ